MISRRHLLLWALCPLVPVTAAAADAPVGETAETTPAAPIEALDQSILGIMRAARTTSFTQRMQMLAPAVQAAYDLPQILRNSVGLRFAGLPPPTQADLLDVFTRFTIASYVANFDEDNGLRFDVLPETRHLGGDEVVQTRLIQGSGEPVKLDYVMRRVNGSWKIIDVLLNGSISRVAVQRSDFRALLGGGDAEPLIASLRGKVARLAAGQKD